MSGGGRTTTNPPEDRTHCAQVLVANVGSSNRLSYTALGDGVNVAARLECIKKLLWHTSASTTALHGTQEIYSRGRSRGFQVTGRNPVHDLVRHAPRS